MAYASEEDLHADFALPWRGDLDLLNGQWASCFPGDRCFALNDLIDCAHIWVALQLGLDGDGSSTRLLMCQMDLDPIGRSLGYTLQL